MTQIPNFSMKPPVRSVPPLENGSTLSSREFLRRYEQMPELKKAELIDGVVYIMASPVRAKEHADPDSVLQTWLGIYAFANPRTKASTNPTVNLGIDELPQPDCSLRLLPEHGGVAEVGADGYINGPPELVVEIAASSASMDTRVKLKMYERAGVPEYLVWRTEDEALDWFVLTHGKYAAMAADKNGVLKSRVFPGLWLDSMALLKGDGARVKATLERGLKCVKKRKK